MINGMSCRRYMGAYVHKQPSEDHPIQLGIKKLHLVYGVTLLSFLDFQAARLEGAA